MKPRVSIIVPNFNHCDFLRVRLESIFNQTFRDFEVIIFDDASTDRSIYILNEFKNHPKVSHFIVNKNNSGSPFKQWKRGMDLAKGEYIWIAETDDFADINFIDEQLKAIGKFDVAVSRTIIVNNKTITTKELEEEMFCLSDDIILRDTMFMVCPIKNVSCLLFKRPSQEQLKKMMFDSFTIIGDKMFYYEFFRNKHILYNKFAISYFRRVEGSVSNFNGNKNLNYFVNYFNQHSKFSRLLGKDLGIEFEKKYINRYFNRVKNHTSRRQKLSLEYLRIVFKFNLYKMLYLKVFQFTFKLKD